jgi:predicted Rossmann fold flavoprotein
MKFFNNLGLVLKEEDNGRIFPRTNQSSSVAEVMRLALVEHGVHILLNTQVKAIERQGVWKVLLNNQSALKTDSLIIATGGRAAHYLGSTGDGLYWAQKLGHSLTPIHAALVPMETVETWPKEIQGIKVEAGIRATSNDNKIGETTGDLLFTSYGVSGTAAMALAGSIAPLLKTSRVRLHIDLFPDMTKEELDLIILHIFQNAGKRTLRGSLIGLLPDRIIPVVARFAKLDEHKQAGKISHANRLEIVRVLKDITLTVSKLRPMKEAQVTAGGIDTREIKPQSLESKLMKGLYFAGEIIDVDGGGGSGCKFLLEILPAKHYLPDEPLSAGHIAIRLQVPSAHYMPLALFNQLLDSAEEFRLILFYPFIQDGLVVVEYKAVEFLAQVRRNTECRYGRRRPL